VKYRCLSVRQPFVEAILRGLKTQEFRTWSTRLRGRILLHASKKLAPEALDLYPSLEAVQVYVGAVVGLVDVMDIRPDPDWPETFAWELANPARLVTPIPWRGIPGCLFTVDLTPEQLRTVPRRKTGA
jgi:hypothetical protein